MVLKLPIKLSASDSFRSIFNRWIAFFEPKNISFNEKNQLKIMYSRARTLKQFCLCLRRFCFAFSKSENFTFFSAKVWMYSRMWSLCRR